MKLPTLLMFIVATGCLVARNRAAVEVDLGGAGLSISAQVPAPAPAPVPSTAKSLVTGRKLSAVEVDLGGAGLSISAQVPAPAPAPMASKTTPITGRKLSQAVGDLVDSLPVTVGVSGLNDVKLPLVSGTDLNVGNTVGGLGTGLSAEVPVPAPAPSSAESASSLPGSVTGRKLLMV